jgi:hypothetical protein
MNKFAEQKARSKEKNTMTNLHRFSSVLIACLLVTLTACDQKKVEAPGNTSAQSNGSPSDLVHSRAVEAAIWGMPAVNYDLMLQEMLTKTQAKVGQVIYWGRPLDWHNQTPTPNPDALYFITFVNTKDGPVVLDLPSGDDNGSFNGNIVTLWQMPDCSARTRVRVANTSSFLPATKKRSL